MKYPQFLMPAARLHASARAICSSLVPLCARLRTSALALSIPQLISQHPARAIVANISSST
jgi:hypothetical protein